MRELNERDMKILTNGFLKTLNERVNGNEDECTESIKVFEETGLKAYIPIVVPHVVQELAYIGVIKKCQSEGQVRITRRGKNRVDRTIEGNSDLILQILATRKRQGEGKTLIGGAALQDLSDLTPDEINEATEVLEEDGMVKLHRYLGTNPFIFYQVEITPKGRREFQQMRITVEDETRPEINRTVPSISQLGLSGSPYGFTNIDWQIINERKKCRETLFVVLGCQTESKYYDTKELKENIHNMFEDAMKEYRNRHTNYSRIRINFKFLAGGYGGHLFNEIVRDIISSDISVFEA